MRLIPTMFFLPSKYNSHSFPSPLSKNSKIGLTNETYQTLPIFTVLVGLFLWVMPEVTRSSVPETIVNSAGGFDSFFLDGGVLPAPRCVFGGSFSAGKTSTNL